MKTSSIKINNWYFVLLGFILFTGCFKDSAKQTFSITRPILAKASDIQSNIKMNAPTSINVPGKMYLYNNIIFLNEVGKGIHVIDNSNPANPINKYFIRIPGNYDMAVKGNILYADCFTDLLALNISNTNQIALSSSMQNIFPEKNLQNGIYIETGFYAIDWITKDTTINFPINEGQYYLINGGAVFMSGSNTSTNNSTNTNAINGKAGSMSRMAIQNGWMYAVGNYSLSVIDITNGGNPIKTSTLNLNSFTETVFPFKDKLFLGGQTGMNIYSVTNPTQPVFVNSFNHARLCDPVIADDQHAYVTLRSNGINCLGNLNELDVLDIQNIQSTRLISTYPLNHPQGLSKDSTTLIICDGDAGLKIFDASSPESIKLLQTIQIANAYDVICDNKIAYVSANDGLYQYDYSIPAQTKLISKISIKQKL